MNLQPNCRARFWPSMGGEKIGLSQRFWEAGKQKQGEEGNFVLRGEREEGALETNEPCVDTCLSDSRSHLLPTTMMGK